MTFTKAISLAVYLIAMTTIPAKATITKSVAKTTAIFVTGAFVGAHTPQCSWVRDNVCSPGKAWRLKQQAAVTRWWTKTNQQSTPTKRQEDKDPSTPHQP